MPPSVQRPLPPMEVQRLSHTRESAAPAEVQEVSLTRLLAESVEETGCTEKDAALSQGYPPNYWSRIKSGEKAAHLDRLTKLPPKVQRAFVAKYARALDLRVSDDNSAAAAIADLVVVAARALKEIA